MNVLRRFLDIFRALWKRYRGSLHENTMNSKMEENLSRECSIRSLEDHDLSWRTENAWNALQWELEDDSFPTILCVKTLMLLVHLGPASWEEGCFPQSQEGWVLWAGQKPVRASWHLYSWERALLEACRCEEGAASSSLSSKAKIPRNQVGSREDPVDPIRSMKIGNLCGGGGEHLMQNQNISEVGD